MRVLVQRVTRASVRIQGPDGAGPEVVGEIGRGLLILVGIAPTDTLADMAWMAEKCTRLRIFADDAGKMNRSVVDVGGGILAVSQFTLYGDAKKGNRPSFVGAARPEHAVPLYEAFLAGLRAQLGVVAAGRFGADMAVRGFVNDGPVTIWLEHPDLASSLLP